MDYHTHSEDEGKAGDVPRPAGMWRIDDCPAFCFIQSFAQLLEARPPQFGIER